MTGFVVQGHIYTYIYIYIYKTNIICICTCPAGGSGRLGLRWREALSPAVLVWWRGGQRWDRRGLSSTCWQKGGCRGSWRTSACSDMHMHINHDTHTERCSYTLKETKCVCVYLSSWGALLPGGFRSRCRLGIVTGVVAVVTGVGLLWWCPPARSSWRRCCWRLMGEVVTGVWTVGLLLTPHTLCPLKTHTFTYFMKRTICLVKWDCKKKNLHKTENSWSKPKIIGLRAKIIISINVINSIFFIN